MIARRTHNLFEFEPFSRYHMYTKGKGKGDASQIDDIINLNRISKY